MKKSEKNEAEDGRKNKVEENGEKNLAEGKENKDQSEVKGKKRKQPCKRQLIKKSLENIMKKAATAQEKSDMRMLEIETR